MAADGTSDTGTVRSMIGEFAMKDEPKTGAPVTTKPKVGELGMKKAAPKTIAAVTAKPKVDSLGMKKEPKTVASVTSKLKVGSNAVKEKSKSRRYEIVCPRKVDIDSWSDVTKTWWNSKSKRERRLTLLQWGIIFGVVVVILLALIIFGIVKAYQYHQWTRTYVDPKLTTRTHICRKMYKDRRPECIFEDLQQHENCSVGPQCEQIVVKAHVNGKLHFHWVASYLLINTTDYSDCGFRKWCIQGKCVDKHTGWWQGFTNEISKEAAPWVERQWDDLPCLRYDPDVRKWLSRLHNDFGQGCNTAICENENVIYGLQIKFYQCDLPLPDLVTGQRLMDCRHSDPMKVFACHRCDPNRPINAIDTSKKPCDPVTDNGVPCVVTTESGVCFAGDCREFQVTYTK